MSKQPADIAEREYAEKLAEASRKYRDDFKYHQADQRADGYTNEFGRFVTRRKPTELAAIAALTDRYNTLIVAGAATTASLFTLKETMEVVGAGLALIQDAVKTPAYLAAAAPLDPQLGVELSQVLVPESVATHLDQVESLARAQRLLINQSFQRHGGMPGPHPDQMPHYKALRELEEDNLARYDHAHDSYSFCINHVCALSEDAFKLGEPATGIATVFGITSIPHTSRGLAVAINPEEEATQNDLLVAEKAVQHSIAPPRPR